MGRMRVLFAVDGRGGSAQVDLAAAAQTMASGQVSANYTIICHRPQRALQTPLAVTLNLSSPKGEPICASITASAPDGSYSKDFSNSMWDAAPAPSRMNWT